LSRNGPAIQTANFGLYTNPVKLIFMHKRIMCIYSEKESLLSNYFNKILAEKCSSKILNIYIYMYVIPIMLKNYNKRNITFT